MNTHRSNIQVAFGLATAFVVLFLSAPVGAQIGGDAINEFSLETYRSAKKYALIVGINEYSSDYIPPLKYCVRDAEALYNVITDPERGGFPKSSVMLLTDTSEIPPTRTNFGISLNKIKTQANENDLVMVFFSGHGYEQDGRAYLLPEDADLDALDYSAIERDAFVRQIDSIVANKVVVILDACHAGGISRGGKSVGRDAALSDKYYNQFATSQGRAFIASCSGGQLSWEDERAGHGVFTDALVRGLSGEADHQPQDGLVTLYEIRRFLEVEVSDWARRNGKTQQPQVSLESAYGDMPIAMNAEYLENQARWREGRRQEAEELKVGLVSTVKLQPEELADAVGLLDRMAAGNVLSSGDEQQVQFIRKLVSGTIDEEMYRSGVRGISAGSPVLQDDSPPLPRGWFATAGAGGFLHAGDAFSSGMSFSPFFRVGYSLRRWAVVGSFVMTSGMLEDTSALENFSAYLLTVGPKVNLPLSPRFMAFIEGGFGGYVGSDVRSDNANFAADIGAGLDVSLKRSLVLALSASFVFSNATLIPPDEPKMDQGFFIGVGLTYARSK